MDEAGSRPPTWSAARSAASSPCSSPPAAAASRWSRSPRPVAGRPATSPSARRSPSSRRCRICCSRRSRTRRRSSPPPRGAAARPNSPPSTSSTSRPSLLAHQMRGAAACTAAVPLIEYAEREGWSLDAERIDLSGPHRLGHRRPAAALARPPPPASATSGCRWPTGSCSTTSATPCRWTCRSETAELILELQLMSGRRPAPASAAPRAPRRRAASRPRSAAASR